MATGTGTLDTSALTSDGTLGGASGVDPSFAEILVGSAILPSTTPLDLYTGFTGPRQWGSGITTFASSSTGMSIGINQAFGIIGVPEGYVSGTSLAGMATWTGQSYTSLGLNSGTYTYTWGSGPTADFLTVDVVSPGRLFPNLQPCGWP